MKKNAPEDVVDSSPMKDVLTQSLGTDEYVDRLRGKGKGFMVKNYFKTSWKSTQNNEIESCAESRNLDNIGDLVNACSIDLSSHTPIQALHWDVGSLNTRINDITNLDTLPGPSWVDDPPVNPTPVY